MWTDSSFSPIYDDQSYVSIIDGTPYPFNFPKNLIKGLTSVTETEKPTDGDLVVIDFSIDKNYTQIWNTRKKTDDEKAAERTAAAQQALQDCYRKRTANMANDGYGTMGEQFDLMFHEGFDAWLKHIQSVKDKFPKPE